MDNIDFNYFLESPKGRCLEKHVRSISPELHAKIVTYPGTKFAEKIYRYFNPGCGVCAVCGSPTKFKSITQGFCECCSWKCSMQNPNRLEKAKATCLERYGCENPSQADSIKKKKEETCLRNYGVRSGLCNKEKAKATCLERYGCENPSQADSIKKKKEETCLRNYGVTNPNQSAAIRNKTAETKLKRYGDPKYNNRNKAAQTNFERYGVTNSFNIPGVFEAGLFARRSGNAYERVSENNKLRCLQNHPDILSIEDDGFICTCPHPECDKCEGKFHISVGNYAYRTKCGAEKCTILNPIGKTNANTSIEVFVETLLLKHNIAFIKHDRTILGGRELDFYIPDHKLAIECNGCYWHSDNFKTKDYHFSKYNDCMALGVQLITIWEDQVAHNKEALAQVILSKLHIVTRKLRAHNCQVKRISHADSLKILSTHLQGAGQASIRLGLFYNNELVSVMTFSKSRAIYGGTKGHYELIRYCSAPGTIIHGGASKLLKYFISQYNPAKIVSFSSNDISIGALYKRLGFAKKSSSLSYWYIEPNTLKRHHRFVYRKSELVKRGADANKSEFEITNSMGLYRIWDSGQTKWELLLK